MLTQLFFDPGTARSSSGATTVHDVSMGDAIRSRSDTIATRTASSASRRTAGVTLRERRTGFGMLLCRRRTTHSASMCCVAAAAAAAAAHARLKAEPDRHSAEAGVAEDWGGVRQCLMDRGRKDLMSRHTYLLSATNRTFFGRIDPTTQPAVPVRVVFCAHQAMRARERECGVRYRSQHAAHNPGTRCAVGGRAADEPTAVCDAGSHAVVVVVVRGAAGENGVAVCWTRRGERSWPAVAWGCAVLDTCPQLAAWRA